MASTLSLSKLSASARIIESTSRFSVPINSLAASSFVLMLASSRFSSKIYFTRVYHCRRSLTSASRSLESLERSSLRLRGNLSLTSSKCHETLKLSMRRLPMVVKCSYPKSPTLSQSNRSEKSRDLTERVSSWWAKSTAWPNFTTS